MSVLAIKNWSEYQHYKDRTAPWIKLYRDMLDSQMWVMSSDASKLLAVCLMMLALRNDNKIPADSEYVKRFGHLEFTPDFSELIKHGFIDFIDENGECLQLASIVPATCPPEREGEQSREEGERETPIAIGKPNCPHEEIIKLYHEILPASPRIKDWTSARKGMLKVRWDEDSERQNIQYWRGLFEYIAKSPFLTGKVSTQGRKPFLLSLDWLVKAENFAKVREGRYDGETAV